MLSYDKYQVLNIDPWDMTSNFCFQDRDIDSDYIWTPNYMESNETKLKVSSCFDSNWTGSGLVQSELCCLLRSFVMDVNTLC